MVEHTDDALLTDSEVYNLKGGDSNFLFKAGLGLGAVAAFLVATKRIDQVKRFEIKGKF